MFANIFSLLLLVALVHPMVAQENLSDLLSDPATQLSRPADRARVVKRMQEIETTRRQNVRARAALLGLPLRTELPNGRVNEIADFDGDRPLYLSTNNVNAAISSGANLLRTSPYSLTGAGVTIGVWDGGATRSTHLELSGRVTVMDGAAVIDHATHVGGTLIASGIAASARGMAASATVNSYEWTSDISEMTTRGATSANEAGKIYLSNHSYGIVSGWNYVNGGSPYRLWEWNGSTTTSTSIETDFGVYNTRARDIDSLAVSTPYYLIFRAAGNDNTDNPANGDSVALTPDGPTVVSYNSASHHAGDGTYRGGFETIGYEALAKNVITIGSAADAVTGGVRDASKAIVSSFSSCGPTDDGRIKPDITANGDGLNSSLGGSDTSYGAYSGTSMATPNACGSAALLIQQFSNLFPGQAMRASTLKGLLIHTADDRGNAGPDYKYGWGLINVKAAADLIQDHYAAPTKIRITESQLTTAIRTRTHSFTWDGVSPIRATLCWTDPAGVALTASDSRSARLVNNLDLKIIAPNGSESFPFVMPFVGTWTTVSMSSSATTGINNTDNTEQVNVSAPAVIGNYQLVVSCPGTVTNGLQNYSILLSGSAPSAPTESTTSLASSAGATGSYSNSVTFTATVSSGASSGTVTFFDGVSILGTGTVTGSGQATYSTTSLALGSHSITAAYGGNVTVAASTSAPLVYTINPKAVTITGVTSSNKIYDGNTTATLSGGTVSGIVAGETVTMVAGTGNFDSANAGTRTVTAINYSLGGTHAENYLLASQPTIPSASITPLPIHLTGTRPYDGTSVATNILSAQNNLDGANLIVGGNANLSGKNVGTRSISIQSPASRVQSTTGVTTSTAINLTLAATPVTGNTLIAVISTRGNSADRVSSITQTGAAWSRATQSTNTNGTTTEIWYAPNVSGAATAITINQASLRSAAVVMEYTGVMTNSSLDKTSTATALSDSAVTGTTEITSQADELWIAGIGIADGRHTLNSPYINAFTIVAFPKSGTTRFDATIYALEKIVNSPGTASSGGTVSLSDNWAGAIATFKALTPTNLTLSGSAAANYTLVGASGSVTITPCPVELTAVTAIKSYDGTTFAAGTPILSPALISGDTTTSLSQAFQTSNAGIGNKSIIPSVIINDGNAGANYTVTTVNNNTGTINPASATVVLSNMTQTYDGNPKPVTATTSPPGLTTSITYDGSATAPTSAGTYPVVATITDPNYVGSNSGTLVIQEASQTITFGAIPAATFGEASFALTATSSSGLTVLYSSSNPLVATVTGNTVTLIGAGTTILTATQVGDSNFTAATSVPQSFTVNPASATVVLSNMTQTYDGNPKPVTATTSPPGLTTSITYDGSATAPTSAGTYPVVATITDPNYVGSNSGTLVIQEASQTITFGEIPAATFGDESFALSATSSSGLAVSYSSSNPLVATVDGNTVTLTGTGTTILTATQVGDSNFTAATSVPQLLTVNPPSATITLSNMTQNYDGNPKPVTATTSPPGLTTSITYNDSATAPTSAGTYPVVATITDPNYVGSNSDTLVVQQASQTITFGALTAATFGDASFALNATSSSGLSVSYSSSNPLVATVTGNTVTLTGVGTTILTASQTGNTNFTAAASVPQLLTVNHASATVTLSNMAQTYDGDPKPVNATTSPPDLTTSITYNDSTTAPTSAGTYPVVATITDPNYVGSNSGTLVVQQASQTITFGEIPAATFGDAFFALTATSSSGLTVSYSSSNPLVATVEGNTVTLTGVGTTILTASQTGDTNFAAAASVPQLLTVNPPSATITLSDLAQTYDGDPKPVTATTSPPGLTTSITYDGSATAPTSAGTYPVVATITDPNYVGSNSDTLVIQEASQTITFGEIPAATFGDGSFALTATSSSGLTVSYSSSNPLVATVDGITVTLIGAGTTILTASQTGDTNFAAAASVQQSFTVNPASATVVLSNMTQTYNGDPKPVTATTSPPGLTTSITYNDSTNAPTSAGTYSVVATITDSNYVGSNSGTLVVQQASQTITFGALPTATFGDASFALSATSSSGLAVSYSSSNPLVATVEGNTVTLTGVGTTILTATQVGDSNFTAAASVPQLLTVNPASATVVLSNITQTYDGDSKPVTATTSPLGLTTSITYNDSTTAPTSAGTYPVVATITDSNYVGSSSGTLVIQEASQTITFGAIPAATFGEASFALTATSSSGLTVLYSSSNPLVATVEGNTVTLTGVGTTILTATQVGDSNFTAATSVPQSFTVNPASATVVLNNMTQTYDGDPKPITATTSPPGLTTSISYNDSATAPTSAGTYPVVATITDPNYVGSSSGTLVVQEASQTITFGALPAATFGDASFALTANSSSGLTVSYSSSNPLVATIDGNTVTLIGAGTTILTATQVGDSNFTAATSVPQLLTVNPASATVTLSNLTQTYDGDPKPFTATTSPLGLTTSITYNDSTTAPTSAGTYPVVATITDPNYVGTNYGTLTISPGNDYASWANINFTESEKTSGLADDHVDFDADHLLNLAEYALGSDPRHFTPPLATTLDSNGLSIIFTRPSNLPSVIYHAESSENLQTWTPLTLELLEPGALETLRARTPLGTGINAKSYIRLRFERQ